MSDIKIDKGLFNEKWKPEKVTKPEYNYYCQCNKCGSYNIWQIEPIIFPCDIPDVKCYDCGHIMSIAESYDYANHILLTQEEKQRIIEIKRFNYQEKHKVKIGEDLE